MAEEPLLSTGELAKRMGASARAVSRWAKEGKIPYVLRTPGGEYRFKWSDVVAHLREYGSPKDDA